MFRHKLVFLRFLLVGLLGLPIISIAQTDYLSEIRVRIAEADGLGAPKSWVEFSGVLALGQSMLCFPQSTGIQKGQGKYKSCAVTHFSGDLSSPFYGFRAIVKLSSPKNIYIRIEKDGVMPVILVTENETQMSDEITQEKYRIQTERISF